jgi:hypothetical protein
MENLFTHLEQGGMIVSSSECTEVEIREARAYGRFFVNEKGYGFVYFTEIKTLKQ